MLISRRRRSRETPLNGPASLSWFFGVSKVINEAGGDSSLMFEKWAGEYGSVYRIPTLLGGTQLVLCDPKAIAHYYSKETYGYVLTGFSRMLVETMIGRGLMWAEGDSHKRQRKTLTPAFSNSAIRHLTPIFIDSAYKVKNAWDGLLEPNGEAVIDVQECLDSIGIAGFSHDFKTLEGHESTIANMFDALGRHKPSFADIMHILLVAVFPILWRIPTTLTRLFGQLSSSVGEISESILTKTRAEEVDEDRSAMGLLMKASDGNSELRITDDELLAQVKVLIAAVSLTWTLLELARNPAVQEKLREEQLLHFGSGSDPTHDELNNSLPYLDAVVHEALRLHAPLWETIRISAADDIIPLSEPVKAANGQMVDRISVITGQEVLIPIRMINRSYDIWGPDAKEFKPERWLNEDGFPAKVKLVSGHRHLLTFSDGARTCLGKTFALAEFKAILSVLIRHFAFELRDGPESKFEMGRGILPRPKVAGEEGCCLPLRVRRVA
ncbi:hypothetical protein HWV62_7559 [Athelia sp. TMB]|nr:hypothetical protein HWV62_7559 [Athelia sp. TMB]